jgi:hypothetical protein
MKKLFLLLVALFLLTSPTTFAFVSDFEEAEVEIYERYTEVEFPYLDGWFARIGISDSRPTEVFSAYGGDTYLGAAFEGDYMLGVIFYDTASTDPGAENWDFNSRPGEGGVDHFTSSVVEGDTIFFNIWIPPKGAIDTQLVIRPYSQYLDWGIWDADSIGIESIYADEGLEEGGWREFTVVLPDTVGGGDILAVGVQFEYSELVNPNDTIYVDLIHSTDYSGIANPIEEANVLTLPSASMNGLKYEISAAALIHIDVYNISGQKVKEIVPGAQSAGAYSMDLDLAPGVYLYKVTANKESKGSKLIILQ